eukprot:TRINITY_DN16610_c0_g2_i1.p1 TRINITY_DN16610_c0_g2~~TRINITY_DN16610_c0_g2_i1.p1  ORF type:complete len:114 (-),score=0.41 TRINITY_DN16610_c0_g2_i1:332-673(-)
MLNYIETLGMHRALPVWYPTLLSFVLFKTEMLKLFPDLGFSDDDLMESIFVSSVDEEPHPLSRSALYNLQLSKSLTPSNPKHLLNSLTEPQPTESKYASLRPNPFLNASEGPT